MSPARKNSDSLPNIVKIGAVVLVVCLGLYGCARKPADRVGVDMCGARGETHGDRERSSLTSRTTRVSSLDSAQTYVLPQASQRYTRRKRTTRAPQAFDVVAS